MSETNLKVFETLKSSKIFTKGERIFTEGDVSQGIYMLCRGRVKLSTCSKEGRVIILHIADPGEILGLSTTVSNSIYIATAEAIEDIQVNYVTNKEFLRFLEKNAEAGLNAVRQLSKNYETACTQICALGLSATVAEKLITLFLGWCKTAPHEADGIHFKISYTHEELAQMIGTSRETVTRQLKIFRDRNLIKREGDELIIPDEEKLRKFIGTKHQINFNPNTREIE